MPFPPVPPEVKPIAHYMKVAEEHDSRNIVISYWCRMYACQVAMKLVPGKKSQEVSNLLVSIMDWLEKTKTENREVDGIADEVAAQAIIEEYAVQLFNFADAQDQAEQFNKNTIKAFYTTGILLDICLQFGDISEDLNNKRRYAKWKAAYIHHCLKVGDTPQAGPPVNQNDDEEDSSDEETTKPDESKPQQPTQPSQPPQPSEPSQPSSILDAPVDQMPAVPATPSVTPAAPPTIPAESTESVPKALQSGVELGQDQLDKAQKYCKWATSALNYDDIKTAVDNLQKALHLLQTGQDT